MSVIETVNAILSDEEERKPSREEAEEAVRTLIRWAGDNPNREGLIETPKRVVKAYEEYFSGYAENPKSILEKTFSETANYKDFVLLKNINFESHCEHHIAPIIGKASIAYFPNNCIVGISKLARIVDVFAKRLQTQETMTSEIAQCIQLNLNPKGVAVHISAEHQCMSSRGVNKSNVGMITTHFTGEFNENSKDKKRFLTSLKHNSSLGF